MFCAMATTIERCKTEGVVDVFQVVKALRVQKPGAVRTVVSLRAMHTCTHTHVMPPLYSFDSTQPLRCLGRLVVEHLPRKQYVVG